MEIKSSSDRQGLQISTAEDMPRTDLTWDFIKQLRKKTKMKIILKGILSPLDVDLAIKYKVDAMYISNHGGRQLDNSPHALQVLQKLDVKNMNIPIFVDGGFRTGEDVYKAHRLGATMVFLGRACSYALENGSEEIVETIQRIKKTCMDCIHSFGALNAEL